LVVKKSSAKTAAKKVKQTKAVVTTAIDEVEEILEPTPEADEHRFFLAGEEARGWRLDQFLVSEMSEISRSRAQQLIAQGKVLLNDEAAKASAKLKGGEHIEVTGKVELEPIKAYAEDIPLDVVYEDKDLAVVNKPAGMTVHSSGDYTSERNRGTLVNALLHRFGAKLSSSDDDLRPGIVHRLDKDTSGLLVVARNDAAHRKLAAQFAERKVRKHYIALVHGWPEVEADTIVASICRDPKNPLRMTARLGEGREAVTHYNVVQRIESPYGLFALVELKIDTGRTHQIRVHMSHIGHPVVGDSLYGAPKALSPRMLERQKQGNAISLRAAAKKLKGGDFSDGSLNLGRNFLHSFSLEFTHPRTGETQVFRVGLPEELKKFLERLGAGGQSDREAPKKRGSRTKDSK